MQYQLNKNERNNSSALDITDIILLPYFIKVKESQHIIKKAIINGSLESQFKKNSNDESNRNTSETISINTPIVTRSAVRKWLLKKPGYFSSGFFPEINSAEDWESIRQRMLLEQEVVDTAQNHPPDNYFHSIGDHWEIRFNGGEKGTVVKTIPFLYLLKYLGNPRVLLRAEDVFRDVQSHLQENECNTKNENDKREVVNNDRDSGLSIVTTTALEIDETSVLDPKLIPSLEVKAEDLIAKINHAESKGQSESVEELKEQFGKMRDILKKEYSAVMDPRSGIIISYNGVPKGKNRPAGATRRNLKRAVESLEKTQDNELIKLAKHLREFLLTKKNIYQPPKSFPDWDIKY